MKTLSLVIPIRNQAHCVQRLLDSLAAQSIAKEIEIIFSDDGSSDDCAAVIQAWSRKTGLAATIVRSSVSEGALRARLKGYAASTAPYIAFADADDTLLGTTALEHACRLAADCGADIVHCRTRGLSPDGSVPLGELSWAAPYMECLEGEKIFHTFFASRVYPPLLIWSKIFSRRLLDIVVSHAAPLRIFRFDDKCLLMLSVFFARKYVPCDEFLYLYRTSDVWPIEKFSGRLRDLFTLQEVMQNLFSAHGTSRESVAVFREYMQRRIGINMGKMSAKIQEALASGQSFASILERTSVFLDSETLLRSILASCLYNTDKLEQAGALLHDVVRER